MQQCFKGCLGIWCPWHMVFSREKSVEFRVAEWCAHSNLQPMKRTPNCLRNHALIIKTDNHPAGTIVPLHQGPNAHQVLPRISMAQECNTILSSRYSDHIQRKMVQWCHALRWKPMAWTSLNVKGVKELWGGS